MTPLCIRTRCTISPLILFQDKQQKRVSKYDRQQQDASFMEGWEATAQANLKGLQHCHYAREGHASSSTKATVLQKHQSCKFSLQLQALFFNCNEARCQRTHTRIVGRCIYGTSGHVQACLQYCKGNE